jgi:hypothetical protein
MGGLDTHHSVNPFLLPGIGHDRNPGAHLICRFLRGFAVDVTVQEVLAELGAVPA